ncbi:MAG: tRNA preQ1(34) S-adenosylmethionine ribosyltransferase-isomerase QueA [Candidatus Kerfeldbacteria bacterium CG15_BIG_FIL_POST_REV_8_21_14_020_45_12]|uniref:S-adenosylmethionine:tRNA ribosyltransferase-isomerase n=1 Tax=Candidatus Kerfeldbacteria bacterium CG15_BIG_FIL_POST_REV_8_21_14_020_45_12 TaxID=2014247 RepID=A0A2M7H4A1_9BACT|nr:MAG: tRNA preQ1(34) S-adenosylmethionine ribosyltransferase-isomerase QueA [Candidatus Kerfeldbacteria bacterium CG15_BIG_FIL_POST_REV_8_21_14_020_45_12]PJA93938.1 MAG: tRNA preQ1(34) S-adenosylmethionine ribosyltransferase-isomerase QueA [Candidatus Kerfeldbacteria bacterium CG_4_9_14_3_um_filter_45_8]
MDLADFAFNLPEELIAQEPVVGGRDQSRLMVLDRKLGSIQDRSFFELTSLLKAGDVLVFNNSRVLPARLRGEKEPTGGKVELLLLHRQDDESEREVWECMIRSRNTKVDQSITFVGDRDLKGRVIDRASGDTWFVEFNQQGQIFRESLRELGEMPIPPYIKAPTLSEPELRERYQTVYAENEGSAAAPTAGLHFTDLLLDELSERGIELVPITLHVGLGTFSPVRVDDISNHKMHSEYAVITEQSAQRINQAKATGRRIVAVGTTTVRTLESFVKDGQVVADKRWTDIFITPGYDFKIVDAMITNFHLPHSTLLMLVSAFAGTEFIQETYRHAIDQQYRFYSFGDAMLIE